MPPLPKDSVLSPNALVLITGVNGLVASATADQCLAYGLRVRGTVRDAKKNAWMSEYFSKKYGAGKFELIEVASFEEAGTLDEAVKGCDGVAHTTSPVTFDPDPSKVIPGAVNTLLSALHSSEKTPSVKRFVFTSSAVAAADQSPKPAGYRLTPETWNDESIALAKRPPPWDQSQPIVTYMASKVEAERALWNFMEQKKPHFVANSVLPDFVAGVPLSVEKQGWPSSMGIFHMLVNETPGWDMLGPQYAVNVADVGRLHLAGLTKPDAKSERIFGYAETKNNTIFVEWCKKSYPDHKFPTPPEGEKLPDYTVTAQPRAEELLKWLGQPGWVPIKQTMKEALDVMIGGKA